jgi:hypothetical protein
VLIYPKIHTGTSPSVYRYWYRRVPIEALGVFFLKNKTAADDVTVINWKNVLFKKKKR